MNKEQFYIKVQENLTIPVLGFDYQVVHSGNIRGITYIEGNKIIISGLKENLAIKLKLFLVDLLKKEIVLLSKKYSVKLNVKYNRITIRDIRSRWGSCSSKGNLSFNFRLIFLPYNVIEYIVVHEMCHLIEMNHSKNFWKLVQLSYIGYEESKQYLKNNGKLAFRYIFS